MFDQTNPLLKDFYERIVATFCSTSRIPNDFVGPFLISTPVGYSALAMRWMYVGQEPLGWGTASGPTDVERLMRDHEAFDLANDYSGAGSPFWTFGHSLDRQINPRGPARSFIWSNIARIGRAAKPGRVPDEHLAFWSKNRLLATEVRLLTPQLVLFVTGPRYDDLVRAEFPGIDLPSLSLAEPIAQISHPELPILSFRSYHPALLRRYGLEKTVRNLLCAKARQVL